MGDLVGAVGADQKQPLHTAQRRIETRRIAVVRDDPAHSLRQGWWFGCRAVHHGSRLVAARGEGADESAADGPGGAGDAGDEDGHGVSPSEISVVLCGGMGRPLQITLVGS